MDVLISKCKIRSRDISGSSGQFVSGSSSVGFVKASSLDWVEPLINVREISWTEKEFPKTFGYETLETLEVKAGSYVRYFVPSRGSTVDREAIDRLIERVELISSEALWSEQVLRIPNALYLGGLPGDQKPSDARSDLILNSLGIWAAPVRGICEWRNCIGVTVDGGEVAKRKVGATLAFGALGALAAKGSKERTYVTVKNADGSSAYFEIDKATPTIVRAKIAPLLHRLQIRFLDDLGSTSVAAPSPGPQVGSMARELRELGKLRDEGLLTPEEFDEQKARVLRSSEFGEGESTTREV